MCMHTHARICTYKHVRTYIHICMLLWTQRRNRRRCVANVLLMCC